MVIFFIKLAIIILLIVLFFHFRKNIFTFLKRNSKAVFNVIKEDEDIKKITTKHENIFSFIKKRLKRGEVYGLKTTIIFILFFILFIFFIKLTKSYLDNEVMMHLDIRLANLLYYLRDVQAVHFFTWITSFGKSYIVMSIVLLVSFLLFILKKKKFIIPFLSTVAGGASVGMLLKDFFRRQRPLNVAMYQENTYSFPSGHAVISMVLYGFILYLIYKNTKSKKIRILTSIFIPLLIILIGMSRIYLGVHYLSDVLGGYTLGGMFLFLGIFLSELLLSKTDHIKEESKYKHNIKRNIIMVVISIEIIFYVLFNLFYKYPTNLNYVSNEKIVLSNSQDIVEQFNNLKIKKYSETLTGKDQQPLSFIVLANNDDEFLDVFEKAGWYEARKTGVKSLSKTAKAAILNRNDLTAPMTPGFWNTNIHNFGLQKSTTENTARKRHHARFWKTDYIYNGKHVYVGTASFDIGIKWFITHKIAPDIDTERDYLFNDLEQTKLIKQYKKEKFVEPVLGKNFGGDMFFTNGEIYIIEL